MGRRLLPAALAGLLVLAACGGEGPDAGSLANELVATPSGALEMRLLVSAGESGPGVGFELTGRYALQEGGLPEAELRYLGITGAESTEARVLATGEGVYLVLDGDAYELPATASSAGAADPLAGIDVGAWVEEASVEEGDDADTVTGRVRAGRALRDLFALAGGFDPETALPQGEEADELAADVRSSSFQLRVPHGKRGQRTLDLDVVLGTEAGENLADALGAGSSLRVTFQLAVEPDDGRLQVEAPADAKPLSELSGAG